MNKNNTKSLINQAKNTISLLNYVRQDLGKPGKKEGNAKVFPCPFCGSSDGFKLRGDVWKCFACGQGGRDVVSYAARRFDCSQVNAAKKILGDYTPDPSSPPLIGKRNQAQEQVKEKKERAKRIDFARQIFSASRPATQTELQGFFEQHRKFTALQAEIATCAIIDMAKVNTYQGQTSLVFPVYGFVNADFVGIQKLYADEKGTQKRILGSATGFLPVFVESALPEYKGRTVIVESIANAAALAAVGLSAICIFSTTNAKSDRLQALQNLYPQTEFFLWLDQGEKEHAKSAQIKAKTGIEAFCFPINKPRGYDVNDALVTGELAQLIEKNIDRIAAQRRQAKIDSLGKNAKECFEEIGQGFVGEVQESLEKAFLTAIKAKEKLSLIEAPTGAGKSTMAAKICTERTQARQTTVYVAANKTDLYQFARMLSGDIKNRVSIICADSTDSILDNTLLVLTHHTYFTRKGFSLQHYGALLWCKKTKPLVIIDEAVIYAQKQQIWIDSGCRFCKRKFKGFSYTKIAKVLKCRTLQNADCRNCEKSDKVYIHVGTHGTLSLQPYVQGYTAIPKDMPTPSPLKIDTTGTPGRYKTLCAQDVYCRKTDLTERKFSSEPDRQAGKIVEITIEEILEDLIKCSYQPRKYWMTATTKDNMPISAEGLKNALENGMKTDDFKFPKIACEIEKYCFWDKSAMAFLAQNTEKIIALAPASGDCDEKQFFAACADMQSLVIKESKHKLQKFCLFLFPHSLRPEKQEVKKILSKLERNDGALWFYPSENIASNKFTNLPRNINAYQYKSGEILVQIAKTDSEKEGGQLAITHSFGPLAQAVNRPRDLICWIDSRVFQPGFTLRPKGSLIGKEIEAGQRRAMTARITQNTGRILRTHPDKPELPKIAIVYGLEKNSLVDLAAIKENFAGMVQNFDVCEVNDEEYLYFAADNYLTAGKLPEQNEIAWLAEKTAKKPDREITPSKRNLPGRKEIKEKAKYESKLEQAREMRDDGACWREIYTKLHLARLSKSITKWLKSSLFE